MGCGSGQTECGFFRSIQRTLDGYIAGGTSYGASSGDKTTASRGQNDFWVIKLGPPVVRITGDTLLCAGGQLQLTAVAAPSAATYRWNTGATSPTITVTQPGLYQVTATFANGQVSSAQQLVESITPSLLI